MVKMRPYGVKRSDVHRQYHNNDVGKMNLHDIRKEVKKSARFEARQMAQMEANQMEVEEMLEPKSKRKLYIAYGSNMDEEQMNFRCMDARLVGRAVLIGYRFLFKGSKTGSYATIEPSMEHNVPILYWKISAQDEKNLDHYEGYPTFYYKKTLKFCTPGGKIMSGMAYIMHEDRQCGIPGERYYGVLEKAYRKFGFDLGILEQAVKDSMER